MAKKKFGMKEEVYFKCKTCKAIVFRVLGAATHSRTTHGTKFDYSDILDYYSVVKNPPADIVKKVAAKQESNRKNRERMMARKKGVNNSEDKTNFMCKECGYVVGALKSLDGHCRRKHGKGYGEIGYTMTDKPVNRKPYGQSNSSKKIKKSSITPKIIGIGQPVLEADGIIINVQVKVPIMFGSPQLLPQMSELPLL